MVKHKGTEVSKAEKKRRKTALQIKKYAGKGPSDSRFNAHHIADTLRFRTCCRHSNALQYIRTVHDTQPTPGTREGRGTLVTPAPPPRPLPDDPPLDAPEPVNVATGRTTPVINLTTVSVQRLQSFACRHRQTKPFERSASSDLGSTLPRIASFFRCASMTSSGTKALLMLSSSERSPAIMMSTSMPSPPRRPLLAS